MLLSYTKQIGFLPITTVALAYCGLSLGKGVGRKASSASSWRIVPGGACRCRRAASSARRRLLKRCSTSKAFSKRKATVFYNAGHGSCPARTDSNTRNKARSRQDPAPDEQQKKSSHGQGTTEEARLRSHGKNFAETQRSATSTPLPNRTRLQGKQDVGQGEGTGD
ncbi:MAG: hypothetical protein V8T46_08545 [Sutterella seckii]